MSNGSWINFCNIILFTILFQHNRKSVLIPMWNQNFCLWFFFRSLFHGIRQLNVCCVCVKLSANSECFACKWLLFYGLEFSSASFSIIAIHWQILFPVHLRSVSKIQMWQQRNNSNQHRIKVVSIGAEFRLTILTRGCLYMNVCVCVLFQWLNDSHEHQFKFMETQYFNFFYVLWPFASILLWLLFANIPNHRIAHDIQVVAM